MFATHRQAIARALLVATGVELPLLLLAAATGFPTAKFTLATWGVILTQFPGAMLASALGAPVGVALLPDGSPSLPALTLLVLGTSNLLLFALLAYLPVRALARRRAHGG